MTAKEMGRRGGLARAKKMTPEERKALGAKLSAARAAALAARKVTTVK